MSNASEPDVDPIRDHKRMKMLKWTGISAYGLAGSVTSFVLAWILNLHPLPTLALVGVGIAGAILTAMSVVAAYRAREDYHTHER